MYIDSVTLPCNVICFTKEKMTNKSITHCKYLCYLAGVFLNYGKLREFAVVPNVVAPRSTKVNILHSCTFFFYLIRVKCTMKYRESLR